MAGDTQKGKYVEGDMIQNSVVIKNTTHDELIRLLSAGNIKDAMKILKMQDNIIGTTHPHYPFYSLGVRKIGEDYIPYSKPLSKEAFEKYPPTIKGKLNFPTKYKDFKNIEELLDYSYKTQTEIEINKIELVKMIGDQVDPYQDEVEILLSETFDWSLKPKEFPEARPFKIVIEGSAISYDYILLRTTRIEENKVFLSNEEQDIDTKLNLVIDFKNEKCSFNINPNVKATKKSLLKCLKFIKSASNKGKLSIVSLELDAVLVEGIFDNFDYDSPFDNIDTEITFLEYISLIEDHYNTIVEIPEQIEKDDLEALYFLGEALKYGKMQGTWKDGTFDFIITEDTIQNIKSLEGRPFDLSFVASAKVVVFKSEFLIPKIIRTFKNAQVNNLDKLKKKVEVLEGGDVVKVTFVAKGDNQYIEQFDFEQSV